MSSECFSVYIFAEYRLEAKERERAQNRVEKTVKTVNNAPNSQITEGVKMRATDGERKEFKRLEKEVEKLENRKTVIMEKFNNAATLDPKDIAKLSSDLNDVNNELEIKEMRWLELSERV